MKIFGKPVSLWSLLAILTLGPVSGIAAYSGYIPIWAEPQPQNLPDFTILAIPVSQTIPRGQLGSFSVDLLSLAGFAGSVTLTAQLSPSVEDLSVAINPGTVSLFTGSATSSLTVSTGPTTPLGNHVLNITGTSGKVTHSVGVFVSVTPPLAPDFSISASPSSLTVAAGSSGFSTIIVTSLNGFQGNVSLTASITPRPGNRPTVSINPAQVMVTPSGPQGSILLIDTVNETPKLTYTVLVVGTSGAVSHSFAIALTIT